MVEGLKLSMTSAQLSELLAKRQEYHEKRAEKFKVQAELEAANDEDAEQDALGIGKAMTAAFPFAGNSAKTRYRHHCERATVAAFRVKYLIPNETYVLTEDDLRTLEVMQPTY